MPEPNNSLLPRYCSQGTTFPTEMLGTTLVEAKRHLEEAPQLTLLVFDPFGPQIEFFRLSRSWTVASKLWGFCATATCYFR